MTPPKIEGTVIDILDYREYTSCKGRNLKCRSKTNPQDEKCKRCGTDIGPDTSYDDYFVSLVLWSGTATTTIKCFRYVFLLKLFMHFQ